MVYMVLWVLLVNIFHNKIGFIVFVLVNSNNWFISWKSQSKMDDMMTGGSPMT